MLVLCFTADYFPLSEWTVTNIPYWNVFNQIIEPIKRIGRDLVEPAWTRTFLKNFTSLYLNSLIHSARCACYLLLFCLADRMRIMVHFHSWVICVEKFKFLYRLRNFTCCPLYLLWNSINSLQWTLEERINISDAVEIDKLDTFNSQG